MAWAKSVWLATEIKSRTAAVQGKNWGLEPFERTFGAERMLCNIAGLQGKRKAGDPGFIAWSNSVLQSKFGGCAFPAAGSRF
jgi:hypothetical protein